MIKTYRNHRIVISLTIYNEPVIMIDGMYCSNIVGNAQTKLEALVKAKEYIDNEIKRIKKKEKK